VALDYWVKVFDRLLPRSRLWSLIIARPLKKFFHGLAILPKTIREHIGSVLLEAFPRTTTRIEDWSRQFGSPELLSPEDIEAEWGAFGGQSPAYIQGVLRAAGFDVYVHEWWVPGIHPPVARNPFDYDGTGSPSSNLIETSYVLVNDLTHVEKNYIYYCGKKPNPDQCVSDESITCGAYDGYMLVPKRYPCPDVPDEYPVYWYVCAAVWPHYVNIEESSFRKLVRLIYKLKPVHTRVILRAIQVPDLGDYDIQDTWWHDHFIYDEIVSTQDDLQDKT
jgi:hypothetical protein